VTEIDKHARYRLVHRLDILVREAERRADKAVPPWLTEEQRNTIWMIYGEAEQRSAWMGMPVEVDHIVPLRGYCTRTGAQVVCGLHVPWNLRPLPQVVNRKKGRWFETDWELADEDIPF
jgi:hypothetical protein